MKTNDNKCAVCANFNRYYTRTFYRYARTSYGYCLGKNEIISDNGHCDNFEIRNVPNKAIDKCIHIDEILTELLTLRKELSKIDIE